MRDITEEILKATQVPCDLWEFEDLMKKPNNLKHKSTEEIDNEYKERVYRKNKKVSRDNKVEKRSKRYIRKRNKVAKK
ncbi:hypothetical protein [Paraclostridium bifermentans]|uniref:hypothetical protein n=1 Tax=Paraclostridium bifermentans TaxID=1490 RepID=UPI00359C8684